MSREILRALFPLLVTQLQRGKSILLLGPRQVGKTTLLSHLEARFLVNLSNRSERLRYERAPELLTGEVEALGERVSPKLPPLVIIDEIQLVPELLDVAQDLIDRRLARFVFTGSSARKLVRSSRINLLPGRVVRLRLDPLILAEADSPNLDFLLADGSLPGIYLTPKPEDRNLDLQSYVEAYLDEEVRAEALVRKLNVFSRFLELAGLESGSIINYSSIASELGINKDTVAGYFEILFDCLLAERVEPITASTTRKKLTRSARFLLFDMGVRRACAGEPRSPSRDRLGQWFEHWVGLELIRICRLRYPGAKLRFWRDPDGPEVDWIVENEGCYTPFEVKWTDHPQASDARHLETFIREYQDKTRQGWIICRTPRPVKISASVTAVPWNHLNEKLLA